jgi:DNA modification methylase
MALEINTIYNGDALEVLKSFPSESINCCVTSPPYYGLRDYNNHGQIGLENTPDEYIEKLVTIFREVYRVLTNDGSLWLNIGDCYAGSNQGAGTKNPSAKQASNKGTNYMTAETHRSKLKTVPGCKPKDLIGIPWALAFALRADGWTLRQDIIWERPNCMPESVRDRCTKSHEYIFLLTKSRKYYFDSDSIKEPSVQAGLSTLRGSGNKERKQRPSQEILQKGCQAGSVPWKFDEYKNKRSVWRVNIKPLREAHFATFPVELVEPCILAGCPDSGTVLDPFIGSGTVGVAALKHNRNYIGIDLNREYCDLARNRINNSTEYLTKGCDAPCHQSTN